MNCMTGSNKGGFTCYVRLVKHVLAKPSWLPNNRFAIDASHNKTLAVLCSTPNGSKLPAACQQNISVKCPKVVSDRSNRVYNTYDGCLEVNNVIMSHACVLLQPLWPQPLKEGHRRFFSGPLAPTTTPHSLRFLRFLMPHAFANQSNEGAGLDHCNDSTDFDLGQSTNSGATWGEKAMQ